MLRAIYSFNMDMVYELEINLMYIGGGIDTC